MKTKKKFKTKFKKVIYAAAIFSFCLLGNTWGEELEKGEEHATETPPSQTQEKDKKVYIFGDVSYSLINYNQTAFSGNYPGTHIPINNYDPGRKHSETFSNAMLRLNFYVPLSPAVSLKSRLNTNWSLRDRELEFDWERLYLSMYAKDSWQVLAGSLPTTYGPDWLSNDGVFPKFVVNKKTKGLLVLHQLNSESSSKILGGWFRADADYNIDLPESLHEKRDFDTFALQYNTKLNSSTAVIASYLFINKYPLINDLFMENSFGKSKHNIFALHLTKNLKAGEVFFEYAHSNTSLPVDEQNLPSLSGSDKDFAGNAFSTGISHKLGKGSLSVKYTIGRKNFFNPLSYSGAVAFSYPHRISWDYPAYISLASLPNYSKTLEVTYALPLKNLFTVGLSYTNINYDVPDFGPFVSPSNKKIDYFQLFLTKQF